MKQHIRQSNSKVIKRPQQQRQRKSTKKQTTVTTTSTTYNNEPCIYCTHCSCTKPNIALDMIEKNAINEILNPLYIRTTTDYTKEKLLLSRLGRLEQIASHFDSLCTKARQDLENHRTKVKELNKRMDNEEDNNCRISSNRKKKSWYLRDYYEDSVNNEEILYSSVKLPKKIVHKAMNNMFAFRRSKYDCV